MTTGELRLEINFAHVGGAGVGTKASDKSRAMRLIETSLKVKLHKLHEVLRLIK